MAKPVIITADSTVDLSQELKERFDIRIIPLMITLGENHFMDDGVSFTPLDMYARYHKDGLLPKTSAPGVQEFLDFFQVFLSFIGIGLCQICQFACSIAQVDHHLFSILVVDVFL